MRLILPCGSAGFLAYFLILNTQVQEAVAPWPLALIGAKLIAKKVLLSGAGKMAAKGLAKGAAKTALKSGAKSALKGGRLSKGLAKGRRGASRLGGKSQAKARSKLNSLYEKYDTGMQ